MVVVGKHPVLGTGYLLAVLVFSLQVNEPLDKGCCSSMALLGKQPIFGMGYLVGVLVFSLQVTELIPYGYYISKGLPLLSGPGQ